MDLKNAKLGIMGFDAKGNINSVMMACEDNLQQSANNFKDMGKSLFAMGLVDRIFAELKHNNTLAAFCIKEGVINGCPAMEIINTCKDQFRDGWNGLSPELRKEITEF